MPGTRRMLARRPLRPAKRTRRSASTRRRARAVAGARARVSVTQAPPQSPYTPLVDAYTSAAGGQRRRSARTRAWVRGSRSPWPGGGARCSTCVARPDSRRRLAAWSRLPSSGVMPWARRAGARSGLEVSASTRTGERPVALARKACATRRPTSPQPTMSTRARRKRAGSAPRLQAGEAELMQGLSKVRRASHRPGAQKG